MTLEAARELAREQAKLFCETIVVFRFPGWTRDTWGTLPERNGLAPNAIIDSTVDPPEPDLLF